MRHCLPLPFAQPQPGRYLIRDPVAPESEDEGTLAQLEVGLGQSGVVAELDHALGAGAGFSM